MFQFLHRHDLQIGYSWQSQAAIMNGSMTQLVAMEVKDNVYILALPQQSICAWSSDSGLHTTSGNVGLDEWNYTQATEHRETE